MRTKRKRIKVTKQRVRFLCLDYYRNVVTGNQSKITGIEQYVCNDNTIEVLYDNGRRKTYPVNEGEKQLKQVIKAINKYLGGQNVTQ